MKKKTDWRKQGREFTRFKVRERDNFTCAECKRKWKNGERHFDVHHTNGLCGKKSRGYDRLKDMPVLITLCHDCHYSRHDFKGKLGAPRKQVTIERDRRIYILRKQEGLTFDALGKLAGISQPAAVRAYYRAVRSEETDLWKNPSTHEKK